MQTITDIRQHFVIEPDNPQPFASVQHAQDVATRANLKLRKTQKAIGKLTEALMAEKKRALLVVFQAMDAAGKDSTIKRVFRYCDPAGFSTISFKKPSLEELRHDFLWRCHKATPQRGRVHVFNRSHYEETLVVRVHPHWLKSQGFDWPLPDDFWQQRYASICDFEAHLHRNGTKVIKFFLNVSRQEQLRRFLDRYAKPEKQWKFSINDYAESLYWDEYQAAYRETLKHTSTTASPWYAIPADDKKLMRKIVARIIHSHLQEMQPRYPGLADFTSQEKALLAKLLKQET